MDTETRHSVNERECPAAYRIVFFERCRAERFPSFGGDVQREQFDFSHGDQDGFVSYAALDVIQQRLSIGQSVVAECILHQLSRLLAGLDQGMVANMIAEFLRRHQHEANQLEEVRGVLLPLRSVRFDPRAGHREQVVLGRLTHVEGVARQLSVHLLEGELLELFACLQPQQKEVLRDEDLHLIEHVAQRVEIGDFVDVDAVLDRTRLDEKL